jgi:hypothetical protein
MNGIGHPNIGQKGAENPVGKFVFRPAKALVPGERKTTINAVKPINNWMIKLLTTIWLPISIG